MKFSGIIACVVSLLPVTTLGLSTSLQDDVESLTDRYLFDTALDDFMAHRAAADPPTVIWVSDGCTLAVDNPLGFEFEPACNRHDFGYLNYRQQGRFTKAAKASIDSNFLKDLKQQCSPEYFQVICNSLADVYHAAVKAFGGKDARERAVSDAMAVYEEKLMAYNEMLAEARASGVVPI